MSRLKRRKFLQTTGEILGAAAFCTLSSGCNPSTETQKTAGQKTTSTKQEWTGFNYSMCNESMKTLSWEKQCEVTANAGYSGIEIAAFTLVKKGVQEITAAKRQEMVKAMEKAGIKCAGLHWLLAPPPKGLHFTTPDKAVRDNSIEYLNKLIDFCGDLGGEDMVFGSPKQRSTVNIPIEEAKKYFAEGLAAVADHAQKRRVRILIEPLDTGQTDVVNTLAEAMEIVNKINHPFIQTMFDFHNTKNETEPFDVLIKKYFDHIYHIHVQEMDGDYMGTGNGVNDYVKAFQTLKDLKFCGWVSLEVFKFVLSGQIMAERSMKVLKQIEAKLT